MNKGDKIRPTYEILLHYQPAEEGELIVLESFMDGAAYLKPGQKIEWLTIQGISGKKYNAEAFHFELITSPSDGAQTTEP